MIKTPLLDRRTSRDIYNQALMLAKHYCPEWADKNWQEDYFDPEDPGLIILKLFSKTTEHLLAQFNRIPEKHQIAFLDFMGIDLLPAEPAKVPLTFYLAEGASGTFIPRATMVAYQPPKAQEVVFETVKGLFVVPPVMKAVFSLNPWEDKYTDHSKVISGKEDGFFIFGRDADEKFLKHVLYLGDDLKFDIRRKAEVTIHFESDAALLDNYFERWYGNNEIENPQFKHPDGSVRKLDVTIDIQKLEKSIVNGQESFWLSVRPKEGLEVQSPFYWNEIPGKDSNRFIRFLSRIFGAEWEKSEILKIDDKNINIVSGAYVISLRLIESKVYLEFKGTTYEFPVRKEDGELNIYYLPEISSISTDVEAGDILPDLAFFNDIPIDVKKGFYPFGESPKAGDVLYLGSEEAFSKENAVITLDMGIEKEQGNVPTLVWEYWDGKNWIALSPADDTNGSTKVFSTSGKISFECPSIKQVEINGKLNRWIKIRISSGNYGTPAAFKKQDEIIEKLKLTNEQKQTLAGLTFGFYMESTLKPPFIKSVNIQYKFSGKPIQHIKTYNNFQYNKINAPFSPYESSRETMPSLFLGFENDYYIQGTSISLYFAVKEKRYGEKVEEIENPRTALKPASGFAWEYYTGKWEKFGVEDETDSFETGGIVRFTIPSDIKIRKEFGKELYWIRARPNEVEKLTCIKLKGIFPNTVWAGNNTTVKDEVIGSGSGKPGLTLTFSRKPVLEGQVIEVKESVLSEDEIKVIEAEEGKDALKKIKDERTGEIKEIWVRWHEVKNFSLSKPLSRHYVVDRANGRISFGDGVRGMMPSRGRNNIIAREYMSGGGRDGNLKPGTITLLKRKIPNIDRVINHVSSSGGRDQENMESAVDRGPIALKNRNRAVTREDFERLAYEASQDVARARCILEGKTISIIMVPKSDEGRPLPDAGLVDTVERYLKERALILIRDRIEVIGPEYEEINVDITVKLDTEAEGVFVKERITKRLETFLHPLKGGQRGEGWDFGQDIFISEVAAVVEGIEGVDYITEITLTKTDAKASGVGFITLKKNALPCAGAISVIIR